MTTISTRRQRDIINIPKDRILCEKCNLAVIKKTFKNHCQTAKHINGKYSKLTEDYPKYKRRKYLTYYAKVKLYNGSLISSIKNLFPIP